MGPGITVDPASADAAEAVEPREASGLTSRLVLAYVEREGGREAVDEVLRLAGLADREEQLRDENAWFADSVRVRLFQAAAQALDDPHASRHVGEASIDLNAGGALKLALRALGSPRIIYSNVVRINAKFNLVHRMDVLEMGSNRARIRNVPLPDTPWHEGDCDFNIGLMSAAPVLFGRPPARVRHPICIGHGADRCVYEIEWSGANEGTRVVAGWSLSGMIALAATALAAPALLPFAAAAATGTAAVAGSKAVRSRRRRWRALQSQAEQESVAATALTASLQDLVAGLDLDEVLAKITSNAQSAVGGTEFALLVDDGEGAMRCRSSSGLPDDIVEALERWAQGTAGLLQAPMVVDNVAGVAELAGLPATGELPLGSLCAAPLSFRDRSLGVLVAVAGAAEGFLPREVELFQSYADQAAIALTNARLYAAQEARASRDSLTGLLNHREFHEMVARELERCRRYGGRMAVALFDLDDFKLVNDTGGHAEGDRVLCAFAQALNGACRASDLAFRIGGDEFALVLPETGAEEAAAAAARVQAQTQTLDRRVHVSSGTAAWPDAGPTKDALLARADDDLYAAKRTSGGAPALTPAAAPTNLQRTRLALASRLSARLAPLADPDQIARVAVDELQAAFGWYLVVVHRLDLDGVLRPVAGAGKLLEFMAEDFQAWEQTLDQGVNGRTARTGEPTVVTDTRRDPDFMQPKGAVASRSELALPIRVGGQVWGVLNLESTEPDAFGPDDVLFGDTIAAAVGAAIQRSALFGELEGAFMRTLAVLSDALEAKDSYTAAHAREVADLAVATGCELGMHGEDLRNLSYAALLHDIGKIAIPTEILRKPGALTDEEFEEIKRHTIIGAQMLERIPFFSEVHPLVRSAHERWDGAGYPDRLAAEDVPLGARVICACDAYHAMTTDRPYRSAMPPAAAVEELRAHAGTQFDPGVVDALLAVLRTAPEPAAA
jgi:diguanylate cyclase (GGDEF)-like protein/putative nucleotidyltransferase with HDIG domain